jgi:hypothetical protein
LVETDPSEDNHIVLKRVTRLSRIHAQRALLKKETELTEQSLTVEEIRNRISELRKPALLLQTIQEMVEQQKGDKADTNIEVTDGKGEEDALIDANFYVTDVRCDGPGNFNDDQNDLKESFFCLMQTLISDSRNYKNMPSL